MHTMVPIVCPFLGLCRVPGALGIAWFKSGSTCTLSIILALRTLPWGKLTPAAPLDQEKDEGHVEWLDPSQNRSMSQLSWGRRPVTLSAKFSLNQPTPIQETEDIGAKYIPPTRGCWVTRSWLLNWHEARVGFMMRQVESTLFRSSPTSSLS